jgi:3-methyladenine DNA glycosylase AlkD
MGRWFIQKAIGWVLREMSKKWPDEVYQFLQKNKRKMSSLSFREGSRKLAESYRKQLI